MGNAFIKESTLTDIANAIRTKTGGTDLLLPSQMADAILNISGGGSIPIVSWADGTDDQIVAMVYAASYGWINLADYWHVGDERTVHLSAMSEIQYLIDESHSAQDVKFVILNKGGKILSNGKECNFIVGLKNSLKEKGYMNSSNTNSGSWNGCARRTWCNSTFRNSIPITLASIFSTTLVFLSTSMSMVGAFV